MPGISLITGQPLQQDKLERAIRDLKKDGVSQADVLYRDDRFALVFSGREDYPCLFRESEGHIFCMEGMIYNIPADDVAGRLQSITQKFSRQENVHEDVKAFVGEADGDFLCVGYSKSTHDLYVFNDRWGRLPAFYSCDQGQYLFSREIKFILHFLNSIVLDKMNITQFLMFEYNLGDRTIFSSVKRFLPSHFATVSSQKSQFGIDVQNRMVPSKPLLFDRYGKVASREKCLENIVGLYLESVQNRASACMAKGFDIFADVSGGFDTRAVLVGLETLGIDAELFTHCLVTGDESAVAKELASIYNKSLTVVNASHDQSENELSDIVYQSDCMVNGWTAGTAWRDSFEKKKCLPVKRPVANFMGFAGGVMRHPLHPTLGYPSMASMVKAGILPASLSDKNACELTGLRLQDYRQDLLAYFNSYPEVTLEGALKRLYFEYGNHLTNAGEDRTRRLFWTVQPFWSSSLYAYKMNHLPLVYASFSLFVDFIRSIDGKALTVPIHGSKINLLSKNSIRKADVGLRTRSWIRNTILKRSLGGKFFHMYNYRKRDTTLFKNLEEQACSVFHRLHNTNSITTEGKLRTFYSHEYNVFNAYRILSVLLYLEKLENMYGEKMHIH